MHFAFNMPNCDGRNDFSKDSAPAKRLSSKHFRDFGVGLSDIRSIPG